MNSDIVTSARGLRLYDPFGTNHVHAKPFVKWAGGKRKLVPEIMRHVPVYTGMYFEPFVGGGALYFGLQPIQMSILSDVNPYLTLTYCAVRDDVEAVIAGLNTCNDTEEEYYRRRGNPPDLLNIVDVAVWTLYLNRCAYNGLWRVNKSGRHNAPHGRYNHKSIAQPDVLRLASLAMGRAVIFCADFEQVVNECAPDDFVYFDPPYAPISPTSNFSTYMTGGFTEVDQERLANVFFGLKARGVHVLMSNSNAPLVHRLYARAEIVVVRARRNINCNPGGRGFVTEVLIK